MTDVFASKSPVLLCPCTQNRNGEISYKDTVDDVVMHEHIGAAGGVDEAAGVEQAVTTLGPSLAQHKWYRRAMRRHRQWLLND